MGEGRGVDGEELRGVQRKGPVSNKRQTMPPSMCANKCVTWEAACANVQADVGGEAAMVHGWRTREGLGVAEDEMRGVQRKGPASAKRQTMPP
jgi:hypothetical protein